MPGPAAILREIHQLRRHIKNLQDEIERGPLLVKSHQNKVVRQEEQLRDAKDSIQKLKVAQLEKESSLKTKHVQIAKHQKQLNEASAKKEYDALRIEIETDKKASAKLEDEILNCMAEIEAKTAQIPELERAVQRAKQEAAQIVDDIQTRRNRLTEELNSTHQKIAEVEANLTGEVKTQYEPLVALRKEDALAAVQGRTCTACYTDITAQNFNDLRLDQFVVCKSCGRILYLQESAAL